MDTVDDLVERLRRGGGDTTEIEVKSALGGLPTTLGESMCGLANLPGGGWILLGLDEVAGFVPVGLSDVAALKQGLGHRARDCVPPVVLDITEESFDGSPVVVARVAECDPADKPCRINNQGWTRSWDGDYRMSSLEEQAFLRQRQAPTCDRRPVDGAGTTDLDEHLTMVWTSTVRQFDPHGLGRFDDEEILVRGGALTTDGVPTAAGLLTLGRHPQQFFPRYVVNLAVTSEPGRGPGTGGLRAQQLTTLSGPIPLVLEGALRWARGVFTHSIVQGPDGNVRDVWQYPLDAVRELVANALVHRDLDLWSEGMAVEVRLTPDRFVVTNPGGLYGITVDRLGREGTTSARNARLVELCRYARTDDGARVVETLATGIPRVLASLAAAGLPPATFSDTGLRFTVVLRPATGSSSLTRSQQKVYDAVADGDLDVDDLEEATGLKAPNVRKVLRALIDSGLGAQEG
jgi:ATP-dependent DNA helicase RecG